MFIFFILLFSSHRPLSHSQALTSLKLSSSLSPSHLKLTISQAQALKPMSSQSKLDPPPSQSPIASNRRHPSHPSLSDRLSACSSISAASPNPRWHQSCFTRPTPPIGVLALRLGRFLVIFYFVWSRLRKKIGDLDFFFFCLLCTNGGGGGVGGGCGCGCECG